MKRIGWLLIAVLSTAFVRVQPVETPQKCACPCCCHCKVPGDCGMPCNRAPAPAPVMFAAEQPARIAQPASRDAGQVRVTREMFYAPFVEPLTEAVALDASAQSALPAGVPLFKVHRSLRV